MQRLQTAALDGATTSPQFRYMIAMTSMKFCIRPAAELVLLTVLLVTTACDGYIQKEKYDAAQKEISDLRRQYTESQESLRKAQEQVAECQAHKYQIFHQSHRTWRLDTVNGTTCILLTTDEDWKKPGTQSQACN